MKAFGLTKDNKVDNVSVLAVPVLSNNCVLSRVLPLGLYNTELGMVFNALDGDALRVA